MFKTIAHRLGAGLAPENSLQALRLSLQRGARAFETDIRFTRDGTAVLLHDTDLIRTTGQQALLSELDFNDLQSAFRLSNGESVPSLQQLLAITTRQKVCVYLELKDNHACDRLITAVQAQPNRQNLIFSCFDHHAVKYVKHTLPDLRCMALIEGNPVDAVHMCKACKADQFGVAWQTASPNTIEQLSQAGIPSFTYTINDPAEIAQARAMGFSGVFSDKIVSI